jgi:hypothetical protein
VLASEVLTSESRDVKFGWKQCGRLRSNNSIPSYTEEYVAVQSISGKERFVVCLMNA